MNYFILAVCFFRICTINVTCQRYKTIYQKIQQEPIYSKFNQLIHTNRAAKLNLHYEQLTVFVPENWAFRHSEVEYNSDLAFYHMSFEIKSLEMLNRTNSLSTVILENPPLWITHINGELYINNAKVLKNKSDYLARSRNGDMGKQQILHMIDEVLDPVIKSSTASPSAFEFLTTLFKWNLGSANSVSQFLTKIQETKLQYVFKQNAGHTYFIPVDSGIGPAKFKMMNKNIILGHVVPFNVLFTRPTTKNFLFESLANDEMLYIAISFEEKDKRLFVKGLIRGVSGQGEFYSEVIKANIPVNNGVIHLISQPLGIDTKDLKPFPFLPVLEKISLDPNLDVFFSMGERTGFNKKFSKKNVSFTFFVPLDTAWKKAESDYLEAIENETDILGKHLIISDAPYSIELLLSLTKANNYTDIELQSESGTLRIMVLLIKGVYYLKWHNRFIKIERPNYECTNGVIHVLSSPLANFRRRDINAMDIENIFEVIVKKINSSIDMLTKEVL
ncbi:unnamed protein product [Diabrotica balteata]|uniref:FAS1 domain-containing protein n=1 Tax=Diabrotica balteata TaxID=107213 RepID=A0A9N9XD87_DIABA|nr:unnamed protein product [Diabrotica balteata]